MRNYEEDVTTFFAAIKERPPTTIRALLNGVKQFLIGNHLVLSNETFWRRLKRRINGKGALTQDKTPTNQELRQILTYMEVKGKAFFLILASSGMRIGEATQLEGDDVDFSQVATKIYIRSGYTKSGDPRIAFISSEATETLKQWLNIRKKYIARAPAPTSTHTPTGPTPAPTPAPIPGAAYPIEWIIAIVAAIVIVIVIAALILRRRK